jgi:Xaa-Pro dipeptidase
MRIIASVKEANAYSIKLPALGAMNLDKLQRIMQRHEIDALVLNSPQNVFYTTGLGETRPSFPNPTIYYEWDQIPIFSVVLANGSQYVVYAEGTEGSLSDAVTKNKRYYASYGDKPTTGFYFEGKAKSKPDGSSPFDVIRNILEENHAAKNIGVERSHIPLSLYEKLTKKLHDSTFKDADPVMSECRLIKTQEEVSRLKRAAEVTGDAMLAAIKKMEPGVTEADLINVVKKTCLDEKCGWNHTNIGFSEDGATVTLSPSSFFSKRQLKPGDSVRMDMGATFEGYESDVARTACLGQPQEKVSRVHKAVLGAQRAVIEAMRPGVTVSELHKIGVQHVRKAGFPEYSRGMIGHCIGVDIEEEPHISEGDNTVLEPNMVFAVELPYYIPSVAGIQPEDVVVVTNDGAEILSDIDPDIYVR